jgi:two-component system NarL family sensor kinase
MRERLEALNGTLSLVSQPGRTVVKAAVPLPAATRAQTPAGEAPGAGTRIAQEDRS